MQYIIGQILASPAPAAAPVEAGGSGPSTRRLLHTKIVSVNIQIGENREDLSGERVRTAVSAFLGSPFLHFGTLGSSSDLGRNSRCGLRSSPSVKMGKKEKGLFSCVCEGLGR